MTLTSAASRFARLALAVVAILALCAAPAAAKGKGHGKGHHKKHNHPGWVYTQTQDPAGNEVVVYKRSSKGKLSEKDRVSTGGVGAAATPPFMFPILDSQGGVGLTPNGRLVFAVNAGDGTVTSFRVGRRGGLRMADRESTGGQLPVSLDTHKGLLYVLNEVSGEITGFRYTSRGQMTPIAGSTESLSTPGAGGVAAQVGFSPNGGLLAVSQRGGNVIDTFVMGSDDTPGPAHSNAAGGEAPFGFEFLSNGILIGSNAGHVGDPADPANFHGSASSYSVAGGALTGIENIDVGQRATCWVVITKDGKFAYMTNTLSESVSRFRLRKSGDMTLLGHTATGAGFPSDEALSGNSKYLYVLVPSIMGGMSHIDVYKVGSRGGLTHIQATPSNLPPGASGLAAR
jgi:6-phosphogluconolactonase (cycloisomerase 2 family)